MGRGQPREALEGHVDFRCTSLYRPAGHLNRFRGVSIVLGFVAGHAQLHLLLVCKVLEEAQAGLLALLNQVQVDAMILDIEESNLRAGYKDLLCDLCARLDVVRKGEG